MTGSIERIRSWVDGNLPGLVGMIGDLVRIPSPTGHERKKAEHLLALIRSLPGCGGAWIDDADNVLLRYNPGNSPDRLLAAAHIDTVFEGLEEIEPEERNGRLYAPSVGDNSTNAAALFFALRYLVESGTVPGKEILFAFTTGEEGMGNLRGMRRVMETCREGVREVIAVDGTLGSVMNEAVASRRYSVTVTTAGGHSWHDFGVPNAIVAAAVIAADIYRIDVPSRPKTTFNIGMFHGGRSINTIADRAEFALDLRSVSPEALASLEKNVFGSIGFRKKEQQSLGVEVSTVLLGERPGGRTDEASPLVRRLEKLRAEQGLPVRYHASSTDANIPISLGIPSVTFGIYEGEGAHTLNEYIKLDSLRAGLIHLLSVLSES